MPGFDEVVRLLAIGIAIEEGHTFASLKKPMQPGPQTRSQARQMLKEMGCPVE